jgi:hypothetical protein
MKKRPSELKFGPTRSVDRPVQSLRDVASCINILTKAFEECPENYCNDYHNAATLVGGLIQTLTKIQAAFEDYECGGCRVCHDNLHS